METQYNTVRDDYTTGKLRGTTGDDYLTHHRAQSVDSHASTGLVGYGGDDILKGAVPENGQIHMFAGKGDDHLILDLTKAADAGGHQGHHVYGGHGNDAFEFTNVNENNSPIVGRIDDFDPTVDLILVDGTPIDLQKLPQKVVLDSGREVTVRVIEVEHPEIADEGLGTQQFLAIGDDIFYALEGARDLQNGASNLNGEERHFLKEDALGELRGAEAVEYENPNNFVPKDFYRHYEGDLDLFWSPPGPEVRIDTDEANPAHVYAGKSNSEAESSKGEQVIRTSGGDDVIDANTGNDTVFSGDGNDLVAGGIDNDALHGETGDDAIWGGDGSDSLIGGQGDDFLSGDKGNDTLEGDAGHDVLVSGPGNNKLIGGGSEDDVNRFHFAHDGGSNVIEDFKPGVDVISIQHEIDPLTIEILEGEQGNVIVNYGQEASVELKGVSLLDFQRQAELRAEEGNPIMVITPDPEDELAQQILAENGFYDGEPPSLYVPGIQYGSEAFQSGEAGGYTYVDESEAIPEDEPGPAPEAIPKNDADVFDSLPTLDLVSSVSQSSEYEDAGKEEEEEEEEEEDDDGVAGDATCFVATAAYADAGHPDVVYLRSFRDNWLKRRAWGRAFIALYWRVGPVLAVPVARNPALQRLSKSLIGHLVDAIKKFY